LPAVCFNVLLAVRPGPYTCRYNIIHTAFGTAQLNIQGPANDETQSYDGRKSDQPAGNLAYANQSEHLSIHPLPGSASDDNSINCPEARTRRVDVCLVRRRKKHPQNWTRVTNSRTATRTDTYLGWEADGSRLWDKLVSSQKRPTLVSVLLMRCVYSTHLHGTASRT
jgi:hypothetical protein